jgi:phosphatidylserine/phosphatidylglycerophosphate/cardiolipin synthase-like enzyme
VDDLHLRVGSSNFNNRSMRMDTECDVILTARDAAERDRITALRNDLVAEHLGVSPQTVTDSLAETGSLIRTIDRLRGDGRSLVPYELPDTSQIEDWIAENEILDPHGPDEMLEPLDKRGLFKEWRGKIKQRLHLNR